MHGNPLPWVLQKVIKRKGISIFCDSPLERGDKGVCRFAATPPQPLFLEGRLKVAAEGSLIHSFCFHKQ